LNELKERELEPDSPTKDTENDNVALEKTHPLDQVKGRFQYFFLKVMDC